MDTGLGIGSGGAKGGSPGSFGRCLWGFLWSFVAACFSSFSSFPGFFNVISKVFGSSFCLNFWSLFSMVF